LTATRIAQLIIHSDKEKFLLVYCCARLLKLAGNEAVEFQLTKRNMKNPLIDTTPNAKLIDNSFNLLLGFLFVFIGLITFSHTPVYSQQTLPTANIMNGNAVNLDGINNYIRVNPSTSLQPRAALSL